MATADHRSELVFLSLGGDRHEEFLEILEQDVGRLDHLDRKSCVEQVGRGKSAVDPAGRLTDMDGDLLQEGDHIMIRPLLDFAHLLDPESSLLADRLGIFLGNDSELGHPLTGQSLDLEPDF